MSSVRILGSQTTSSGGDCSFSVVCKVPSFEVVSQVPGGLKAIKQAEQLQPTVVLPGLNGIEAGGRIRKLAPETKIVCVSEKFDRDTVHAALNLEASGVRHEI